MATRIAGVTAFINYANSNGTLNQELISWDVDALWPMGKSTPLDGRPYMQDLGPSVTLPEGAAPGEQGYWLPYSQIQLELRLPKSAAANVTLDPSSVLLIPARQMVADAPDNTEPRQLFLKLSDFVDFSGTVTLQPGEKKNLFSYTLSPIEYIKLGIPSQSPLNMNNNTLLIEIDQT
jgi:hypothetical protein